MKGILGFAAITVNALNQIESFTYVEVDSLFQRISTGMVRRNNLGDVTDNFCDKLNWLRQQNVYNYALTRVNHQDGSATITIHNNNYRLDPQQFYNDFLVERYERETSPVR